MKKKKILIINGHPDKESFNYAISEAYKTGGLKSGSEIKEINHYGFEIHSFKQKNEILS